MVKAMVAMDIRQEDIARMLNIRSVKTLRKRFPQELARGLPESLFNRDKARSKPGMAGNSLAQINWLSRHKRCTEPAAQPASSPPPFIVCPEPRDKP